MSDAGIAPPEPVAPPSPTPAPAPVDDPGLGGPPSDWREENDDVTPPPQTWPDDWRERYSGGDEKLLARAKRYSSPENVFKALVQAQDRIRTGSFIGALPEDASPEEVAAHHKQAGIPDKAEGYGLEFPKETAASETDKAELSAFQEKMHTGHVPPAYAKAAFNAYLGMREAALQRYHEASQEATVAAQAELRAEYGRDYRKNFALGNEFLVTHFGDDTPALLGLQLPNGLKLGNDPRFVRGVVKMALAYAEDGALAMGDAGGGGKSIDDEYKEMIKAQAADPKKATDKDFQARLNQIAEQRERRNQRGQRAA